MSCASATKPATTIPPAQTPPTATTSPATPPATPPVPSAPAVTAPVAPKAPSWGESTNYADDKYGVSFSYPKSWINQDASSNLYYAIAASSAQSADKGGLGATEKADDIAKAIKASYDASPALSRLNVKVNIVSSKATTLADGKTPATEVIIGAKVLGMYDLWGYALAIVKGDKIVFAAFNTFSGPASQAVCQEIAQTLAVK
jgi:hypothetical protein